MGTTGNMKLKPKEIRSALKRWMEINHKNELDVASATGVSLNTIRRLLDGETECPSPLVSKAIQEMMARTSAFSVPPGAA